MSVIHKIRAWIKRLLVAHYSNTMSVIAVLIVFFIAACFTLFSPYIAKIQLSTKIDKMSNGVIDNYSYQVVSYQSFMVSIVNGLNFDCKVSDRGGVEQKANNNYIINRIDMVSSNHVYCSSFNGTSNITSQAALNTRIFKNSLILKHYVDPQLLSLISMDLKPILFIIGAIIGLVFFGIINIYIKQRLSLHSLIIKGINRKEFIPYYQPIINVNNNSMYGCEVLVRWLFNNKELISPNDFIPYAESSGLIIYITDILLEKTLIQLSSLDWKKSEGIISINLVPEQLEDKQRMRKAVDLIIKSSIPPRQIAFEITERMSFTDLDKAAMVIDYLKAQGINVKLDDAGTGYGSFSYIQHLNLQSLKIDKMFVDTIDAHNDKLSVLDSIIAFGKKAGMEMIAEGVETKEQSDYLLKNGIYLQQGFYFSEPLTFEQFSHYFQQDQAIK